MSTTDFSFTWDGASGPSGPWSHLEVVQIRGTEELSSPFRYELVLFARAAAQEVEPRALVSSRATLRIRTLSDPSCRLVHGIVAEAEELGGALDGMLYRVVLVPPIVRAAHRKRCRIFLEKTIRQIIDAVLTGDPLLARSDGASADAGDEHDAGYSPAAEVFAWRVSQSPRVDQRYARPYCVQYNESDLAFVSRLLEEEGITYHYEHGAGTCILVLSDADSGRARLSPFAPLGDVPGRGVGSMKLGARLRPRVVTLDDYNWRNPSLEMRAQASSTGGVDGLFETTYPGGFVDSPGQGAPLAAALAERNDVEAAYAVGEGTVRLLSAGALFSLQHPKPRYEGEYLVTRLEVRAEQQGVLPPGGWTATGVPFSCRFECARRGGAESHFRPERRTPRPRIHGSQTAVVTAEPSNTGAVVNVGAEIGCVRVRFPWDKDTTRLAKEPSSCWIRVSQMFAGAGQGAVSHPRVGVEVIVEYLDGDPDRPIVSGRVYNGANLPPAVAVGQATATTLKSYSVPGGAQYNEIRFEDAAGAEELHFHAGRDMDTVVEMDRQEVIKRDSISTVQQHRWENTYGDRMTSVTKNNIERVKEDERVKVMGNQSLGVGFNQNTSVGGDQGLIVAGSQRATVGGGQLLKIGLPPGGGAGEGDGGGTVIGQNVVVHGPQTVTVHEAQTTTLNQGHTVTVTGDENITVHGMQVTQVEKGVTYHSGAFMTLTAASAQAMAGDGQWFSAKAGAGANGMQEFVAKNFKATADEKLELHGKQVASEGTFVTIKGASIQVLDDAGTVKMQIALGSVLIMNAAVSINGEPVTIMGGKSVDVSADVIKLNC